MISIISDSSASISSLPSGMRLVPAIGTSLRLRERRLRKGNCFLLHRCRRVSELVAFRQIAGQKAENASMAFILGHVHQFMGDQLRIFQALFAHEDPMAYRQPGRVMCDQAELPGSLPQVRLRNTE